MNYTTLLGKTLRDVPQSIRTPSHALLHRGGFVRRMAQGLYSFLPLGMRVLQNIQRIIAEEMESLGGQEIYVPVVTPSDIWRRSGRLSWISELTSFHSRGSLRRAGAGRLELLPGDAPVSLSVSDQVP
jgi:prolyl-tRNA synthetase